MVSPVSSLGSGNITPNVEISTPTNIAHPVGVPDAPVPGENPNVNRDMQNFVIKGDVGNNLDVFA